MPDPTTLAIPAHTATNRQLLLHIIERIQAMSDQTARLTAAVDQELTDDAAQNQLITQQRGMIDELRAALDNAVAGGAADRDALAQAYAVIDDAASRLESNDPTNQPEPGPTPEPQPTEPTEPEPTPEPAPETPTEPTP